MLFVVFSSISDHLYFYFIDRTRKLCKMIRISDTNKYSAIHIFL